MIGQDAEVQHIRIGNYNTSVLFDIKTGVVRGIAVEGIHFIRKYNIGTELSAEIPQLVLGQGFGGNR